MDIYSNLLGAGWTMNDIDIMDFLGYLEILAFMANTKVNEEEKLVPLDVALG